MRINVDGIDMGQDVFSEVRVEPSEIRGQFKITRPAIQFNGSLIDTGIRDYELDINCYWPLSRRQEKTIGQMIVHNESNSSFGAGWTISGLQRAHTHSSGRVMLTEGTATSLIFDPLDPALDPNGMSPGWVCRPGVTRGRRRSARPRQKTGRSGSSAARSPSDSKTVCRSRW